MKSIRICYYLWYCYLHNFIAIVNISLTLTTLLFFLWCVCTWHLNLHTNVHQHWFSKRFALIASMYSKKYFLLLYMHTTNFLVDYTFNMPLTGWPFETVSCFMIHGNIWLELHYICTQISMTPIKAIHEMIFYSYV